MPTSFKSSLSWHSAWHVSLPVPILLLLLLSPQVIIAGVTVSAPAASLPSITLLSLLSFPSSLTCVGPHQSCVAERVSAHINPSPPLTRRIGKCCGVDKERMQNVRKCEYAHLNLSLNPPPPKPRIHRWARIGSTLPWWLTASSCGSLCLCACSAQWACFCSHSSRITQSRPSPAHQADHLQATNMMTAPPANQHSRTRAGGVGGDGVWVLLCQWNWNQNCNWTAITPITFILTFFAKNNIFLVWREKQKHHHTLTCRCLSRCFMAWPALLQLGSKDALIYSLLNLVAANQHFSIDADRLIEPWHTRPQPWHYSFTNLTDVSRS